ncbi:hypothetical protein [Lactiplantibacillus plantarum]|uniref:hypothetical protein n=1 Tax=Lactiplantibacillus plantarum TaxID=1590 RepID=UPI001D06FD1A|nr:hypothetical protein [Lactiplantibacillus plantarum]MCB7151546.1 hypothetical protein [Lactiplantibacillus plantarum]MCB7172316.1 hypothetical protein [Lactiplantibacillus plantarum]
MEYNGQDKTSTVEYHTDKSATPAKPTTPVIGNVALAQPQFSKRTLVMIYATKEAANDLSNLQPVKEFTSNRDQ